MEFYADIILPLARQPFTFSLSEKQAAEAVRGMCVTVRLGARKFYTGVIYGLHGRKPDFKNIRRIERLMPAAVRVSETQLAFWEWISSYYMCTLGEVMRAAMPAALKPAGFSDTELSRNSFRPKPVRYVRLGTAADTPEKLREAMGSLGRAPKQKQALSAFCTRFGGQPDGESRMPLAQLPAEPDAVRRLAAKGILRTEESEGMPAFGAPGPYVPGELPLLTPAQQQALEETQQALGRGNTALLHGVTGSGKTEIYIRLIDEQLRKGNTVLYLLPEIALTSQLTSRLETVFGGRLTVCHSRLTRSRRAEIYNDLAGAEGGRVILGVRSAVFQPLNRLGLVIADEEHDSSYKQSEGTPRYNARDCAVWLARACGAGCVMGSATPSLESYSNARAGKYALVRLTERYGDAVLPRTAISNTLNAVKRGERITHFNKLLLDRLTAAVNAGRQVILFQNRRGWSPYIECTQCGWTARCPDCSVTLTYHKADGKLRCHYCGHAEPFPHTCPGCGSEKLVPQGFGTEKAADELSSIFPSLRVARLDRDTATSPKTYAGIIAGFARGNYDVLVGTQMVTKGFDFPGVSLVGILNADNLLNFPDFRAAERAFQTIVQVSGRSGRTDAEGEVVIQTSQPNNPVIRMAASGDYEGMAAVQLAERSAFGYPPYGRLIIVSMRHGNKQLLSKGAWQLADRLKEAFGRRMYGPHPPAVDRIGRKWILCIMLKIETGRSMAEVKRTLTAAAAELAQDRELRKIDIICDVDPQ